MAVNTKVLELANKISRTKMGSKNGITPERPEYKVLAPVITTEMAEVGLCLEMRKPMTVEDVHKLSHKSLEETDKLLRELAWHGACIINEIEGVDHFWLEPWVPGVMELMVNHKENAKKHPEIPMAFEEYGRIRAPLGVGIFPVGLGPMRVIPIEKTIDGNTKKASYEEISMYLNDNSIFSVSDCSCRTSREAMGEGCGHLKEEMCIQMGDAAKYYIRTGRGREITREEAFKIIDKAEQNGLAHCIPNLDGVGKTHAICNCCGCSCFALRNAGMFYNNDMVRSNYVSKVDPDKCVACGECVEVCPTNAARLTQKICSNEPLELNLMDEFPIDTEWGVERWNKDYRTNRENVWNTGTSPCITKCPAHIPVQGYIKLAAQGDYRKALELIKKENPFPAVCGRICPKKCESECTRGDIDEPVAVDDIKKFIAEQDLNIKNRYIPVIKHHYNKKIAVIGGGPSGLSCAYYLAIEGYQVTVFEKEQELGGMLTLGIPSYRLEKNVIEAEIEVLKALGVQFETGVEVGKAITLKQLRSKGFEAFYLAIGAQKGRMLSIEGESAEGVMTGVDFLKAINLNKMNKIQGKVIVIGGGNVAIDVSRTAMRAGASSVELFSLESRAEMPALTEEIEEALAEEIMIQNGWGPKRIIEEKGKVKGVEFVKCIAVKDSQGRFNPQFDPSEVCVVEADHVLVSVGQAIEWGMLAEGSKLKINPNQTLEANNITLQTHEPDVFAGGDVVTGPYFAIDAIAQGKEASISIHRYVHPGQSLVNGRDRKAYQVFDKNNLNLSGYDTMPRQSVQHVDGKISKTTFSDLRESFTEDQVKKETERCLSCGASHVDPFRCVGCGACANRCKFEAISLERVYDAENVELEKLKPKIIRAALKRKGRIQIKKIKKAMGLSKK